MRVVPHNFSFHMARNCWPVVIPKILGVVGHIIPWCCESDVIILKIALSKIIKIEANTLGYPGKQISSQVRFVFQFCVLACCDKF